MGVVFSWPLQIPAPPMARRSFRKIAELDLEVAVFGHGAAIRRNGAERFRQEMGRLAG